MIRKLRKSYYELNNYFESIREISTNSFSKFTKSLALHGKTMSSFDSFYLEISIKTIGKEAIYSFILS
jgi:hypothetical protein